MNTPTKCFIVKEVFSETDTSVCNFLYENCIRYHMKVIPGAGNGHMVIYTAQMTSEDASYITLTFPSLHITMMPELTESLSM